MAIQKTDDVRTVDLLGVRISYHRARSRAARRARPGRTLLAVGAGLLALLSLDAIPATAATTGSNTATVQLTPPPVRSVTVSPSTAAFGNCSGPNETGTNSNPAELAFPNGSCLVGTAGAAVITGGITITNGTAAGSIDVNGQAATPADAGTPWSLVPASAGTPGVDQFVEATDGSALTSASGNYTSVTSTPTCDTAFTVVSSAGSCAAAAGQSSEEALVIEGPSSSTDQNGPFTITTTWTAVP